MIHAIIFGAIFLLMLAFVAGGEKVCDWCWMWKRRRNMAIHDRRYRAGR